MVTGVRRNSMRVLICGGGIAGLTLAGCLERRGMVALLVSRRASW
jgi:2-polyprenyl-6-methoxyphenol hydroxylase-like FAD-dependent oxidoreductase